MNDPASEDRILRLNAALDGELDAASSLELEREMRADPGLAAEFRRLEALRAAIGRHVPREAAPQGLADRIAALAAPAATVVPLRSRNAGVPAGAARASSRSRRPSRPPASPSAPGSRR